MDNQSIDSFSIGGDTTSQTSIDTTGTNTSVFSIRSWILGDRFQDTTNTLQSSVNNNDNNRYNDDNNDYDDDFDDDYDNNMIIEEKRYEIEKCLNNDNIDLWELRNYAFTYGGYIDPSIRKRVYTILTSSHLSILQNNNNNNSSPVSISHMDLLLLHRDVKKTIWNVQEQYYQQKISIIKQHNNNNNTNKRRVSFAPFVEEKKEMITKNKSNNKRRSNSSSSSSVNQSTKSSSPVIVIGTSTIKEEKSKNDDEEKSADNDTTNTNQSSLGTHGGGSSSWSTYSAVVISRRIHYRKTNMQEQKIICNVISSCLRTCPIIESIYYDDDRYHYYVGLHNLTAILMINLESPSLTSLVLSKLATYHLRDAMRKQRTIIETALQLGLFPLLHKLDSILYKHIVITGGIALPTFALSWITSWYTSDIIDITVASRIVDACIVSHPLFPIYIAVAILICNRNKILHCKPNIQYLYTTIRTLPPLLISTSTTTTTENNNNNNNFHNGDNTTNNDNISVVETEQQQQHATVHVEEVIEKALEYISQYPPSKLLELSQASERILSRVPAVVMLNNNNNTKKSSSVYVPEWFTADTTPSEWTVLQMAKAAREKQKQNGDDSDNNNTANMMPNSENAEIITSSSYNTVDPAKEYPLVMAAIGRGTGKSRSTKGILISLLLIILLIIFILLFVGAILYNNSSTLLDSDGSVKSFHDTKYNMKEIISRAFTLTTEQEKNPAQITKTASSSRIIPKVSDSTVTNHEDTTATTTTVLEQVYNKASEFGYTVSNQFLSFDDHRKTKDFNAHVVAPVKQWTNSNNNNNNNKQRQRSTIVSEETTKKKQQQGEDNLSTTTYSSISRSLSDLSQRIEIGSDAVREKTTEMGNTILSSIQKSYSSSSSTTNRINETTNKDVSMKNKEQHSNSNGFVKWIRHGLDITFGWTKLFVKKVEPFEEDDDNSNDGKKRGTKMQWPRMI